MRCGKWLDMRLTICGAGQGIRVDGAPPLLVCGRVPGHLPPHRDVSWPVSWIGEYPDARICSDHKGTYTT